MSAYSETTTVVGLQDAVARIEAKLDRLLLAMGPKRPADDGKIFKALTAKYWNGDDYTGSKFSECPADFLRAFAKYKGACVWAAQKSFKETGKDDELKYVDKNTGEAKLAIAWAEYREATETGEPSASPTPKPQAADDSTDTGEDSIPF